MVFVLIGDAGVVMRPGFREVEEWSEFGDQVDSGCLVDVLLDERTLLTLKWVEGWFRSH